MSQADVRACAKAQRKENVCYDGGPENWEWPESRVLERKNR